MSEAATGTRVLVAEDSPTQAAMLRAILEEEDFTVVLAADGREAADLLGREAFAIVLSDIVMPGMDGFELCRRVKAATPDRRPPVILLTAMDDPLDVARGLESGADDFVAKPYDPAELIAKVRRLLAAAGGPGAGGPDGAGDRARMIGLLVGALNASARKGAELVASTAELALARQRLRVAQPEPGAVGVFTVDAAGTVTSANAAAATALGWEGGALRGLGAGEAVLAQPEGGGRPAAQSVAGVLRGAPGFDRVEAVFRTRSGAGLAVVHACMPMTAGPTGPDGVVVIFHVRPR